MSREPDGLVGETLQGTYVVEELVGEGGMALVYRARHRVLEGDVALKVLQRKLASREDFRTRFLREARLQYQVHHPHIVRVLDFLEDEGLVGCVLEWCDGGQLDPAVYREQGDAATLRRDVFPLLDALGEVHKQGFIHRDIKPANILLHHQQGKTLWKLSDFGLLKDPNAEEITHSGAILGTFRYISPEQFEESKDVDTRADIYSLGVVLYELLLGRVPFAAKMPRLALQILEAPVPFPAEVSPVIREVLSRALAKRPEDRYPDCESFKKALDAALCTLEESQQPAFVRSPSPRGHSTAHRKAQIRTEAGAGERAKASARDDVRASLRDVGPWSDESGVDEIRPAESGAVEVRAGEMALGRKEAAEDGVPGGVPEPKGASLGTDVDVSPSAKAPSALGQKASATGRWRGVLLLVCVCALLGVGGTWMMGWWGPRASRVAQQKTRVQPRRAKARPSKGAWFAGLHKDLYLHRAVQFVRRGNWGQARYFLRSTCRIKKGGCYWYALWVHKTLTIWRKSCQDGDPVACHWAAVARKKGLQESAFVKRALPAYRKACAKAEPRACLALADLQKKAAKRWLTKACKLGHPQGCLRLGRWYAKSHMPVVRQHAEASFRRGCHLQEPEACLLWGLWLRQKTHPKAHTQANNAFRKACTLHDPRGCRLQYAPDFSRP